jgi:rifampicin phosphotransferase
VSAITSRRLRDLRMTDAAEVGGKAASLGELLAAGMCVPDGVVLTHGAVGGEADDRDAALRAATADLGAGPFAVRSSGIAEDGAERSYAGIYESVLDVRPHEIPAAVDRVLASAAAARVAGYDARVDGRMAVIIQRMIRAVASGVALTADPISGDRCNCIVTAVRGTGERLVSGEAAGDEWAVGYGTPRRRRRAEGAIDRREARMIASAARQIADARGKPQDVEWAIDAEGDLWILQARPMTALPPAVSWDPPARGAYSRTFRLGEWIAAPVTPLFESWLLATIEDELHRTLARWTGLIVPEPPHVVVNGWYFYSLNWFFPAALARSLPGALRLLVRNPRRVAGAWLPTARFGVRLYEQEWRHDLLPRYRTAVAHAEERLETLPVDELPALVDELAALAGEYFASIAALAGAGYKLEINLGMAYRRHLSKSLGGTHLPLVAGLAPPTEPDRHAVVSLDWSDAMPPMPTPSIATASDHERVVAARQAAELAAFDALAGSPRRLRRFRRLVADAQYLVPLREEQLREFTLPWPVMRRAVLRIGERLAERGAIADAADVFFLTHDEALRALRDAAPTTVDTVARRARRAEQARLVAPMTVGPPIVQRLWDLSHKLVGGSRSDRALVSGVAASPGQATGLVRVIRSAAAFDELESGEILVAPVTAPAWTPLFTRAAAVVTDVGSAAAHASIIAREYGIPAVVGCGDATARLRTGMRVTVDGTTGNVEPA